MCSSHRMFIESNRVCIVSNQLFMSCLCTLSEKPKKEGKTKKVGIPLNTFYRDSKTAGAGGLHGYIYIYQVCHTVVLLLLLLSGAQRKNPPRNNRTTKVAVVLPGNTHRYKPVVSAVTSMFCGVNTTCNDTTHTAHARAYTAHTAHALAIATHTETIFSYPNPTQPKHPPYSPGRCTSSRSTRTP